MFLEFCGDAGEPHQVLPGLFDLTTASRTDRADPIAKRYQHPSLVHAADVLGSGAVDDLHQLGPQTVVVGEHHHVEAAAVDCRVCDRLQIRGVGRDTEEAYLPLFLQSHEGLVEILVQQA